RSRDRLREPSDQLSAVIERVPSRRAPQMRNHDDVGEAQQLVIVPAGCFVERIQGEAREPPGGKRLDQGRALDHVGARNIHDESAWLDFGETRTIEKMAGPGA